MANSLRTFLTVPEPAPAETLAALRRVYLVTFLGHNGVALLVGMVTFLFASAAPPSGTGIGPALFAVSLAMPLVALIFAAAVARVGGKPAALSATLLAAVLLAAPAWMLVFAWITGHRRLAAVGHGGRAGRGLRRRLGTGGQIRTGGAGTDFHVGRSGLKP